MCSRNCHHLLVSCQMSTSILLKTCYMSRSLKEKPAKGRLFHTQKNLAEMEECCEHPWRDLFLWAVLQNRQHMANYFWAMVSLFSITGVNQQMCKRSQPNQPVCQMACFLTALDSMTRPIRSLGEGRRKLRRALDEPSILVIYADLLDFSLPVGGGC